MPRPLDWIFKHLKTEPGAAGRISLLFLHSFFSGVFISIYFSTANAEFLNNYGIAWLPAGYLASGLVSYISVLGYTRLLKRRAGYSALQSALFFLFFITAFLKLLFYIPSQPLIKITSLGVFLFARSFVSISALEQSAVLSRAFNLPESKKYAGIIGAGGIVASIIGYISIPLLMPYLHSRIDVLFIALAGMGASIYYLHKINVNIGPGDQTAAKQQPDRAQVPLRTLLQNKFIRLMAVCGGISMMALCFIDFSFSVSVKKTFATPEQLSSFMGVFFCILKTGSFIMSLLSPKIFRILGLKIGIITVPAICLFLAASLAGVILFPGNAVIVVTVLSLLLRMLFQIFREAIEDPTFRILYLFLPPTERLETQAKIEGATKQLFIIAASSILLITEALAKDNMMTLIYFIVVPLYAYWFFSALRLVSALKEKLAAMLSTRQDSKENENGGIVRLLERFFRYNHSNDILDMLLHSTEKASPAKVPYPLASPPLNYYCYVPHHKLNYLKHEAGFSRFEMKVDNPILILPPLFKQTRQKVTYLSDTIDEKELLAALAGVKKPDNSIRLRLLQMLDESENTHCKRMVINILSQNNSGELMNDVETYLNYPDYIVQTHMLKTMERKGFKADEKREELFLNTLDKIIYDLAWLFSVISAIPPGKQFADLAEAIKEEELQFKDQLLSVLSWKYDANAIKVLRKTFVGEGGVPGGNMIAMELLENILERELKRKVIPVFESSTYAGKVSVLAAWYYFPKQSPEEALVSLVHRNYNRVSPWVKACALKALTSFPENIWWPQVGGCLFHPNLLIREVARCILQDNKPNYYLQTLKPYGHSKRISETDVKDPDLFERTKLIKRLPVLKKATHFDLLDVAAQITTHQSTGTKKVAGVDFKKDDPLIILEGRIILEFSGRLPATMLSMGILTPAVLQDENIISVFTCRQSRLMFFPRETLNQLMISSEEVYMEAAAYAKN